MKKDELKILFIGNSFSDNMIHRVYPIAKAFGYKRVRFCNLYIGGCPVERHVENAKGNLPAYEYREVSDNTNGVITSKYNVRMIDAIKEDDWDFISMQQASHYSGLVDKYNDGLINWLTKYVLENKPNSAKIMWHMTWAYETGAQHPDFIRYDSNQLTMYNSIINCVKNYVKPIKEIEYIIPSGTTIQNLRTSYFKDHLTIDGYHLNDKGEFAIGLTLILTISNKKRSDFDDSLFDDSIKKDLDNYFESSLNAITSPFTISESTYK